MPASPNRSQIFLVSPATAHGPRAAALRRPDAESELARRLREEGAPLGDVFSFLSGLYFRGKLEYARVFARSPAREQGVHIITMTDGLVSPDARISTGDLERYALCGEGTAAAARMLEKTAAELAQHLGDGADVVLLGSVSTGKYTDLLAPIFGDRLLFPREVLHIGQLARGALFLRCARAGEELQYVPVSEIVRGGRGASLRRAEAPGAGEGVQTGTRRREPPPNTEDARADFRR